MSFIKTVKSRAFSHIFATTLSALLMAFNINFAHADIISASELMCPNVLHDGVSANLCSNKGICTGSNTANLSNGEWSVEFSYGTIKGNSQCVGTNSYSNGQQYYDCKCNTQTFTPTSSNESVNIVSPNIKIFTSTDCHATCTQTCVTKMKKDFEFRENIFSLTAGCLVVDNYPSQPCENLLLNGTNTTIYSDENAPENFQKGDWEVNFDYGTITGTSVCVGTNSYSNGKQYYDCKCNTQTFTPFGGEIERALSSQVKMFTSQTCPSTCAQTCANKIKNDFEFRKKIYNTKMECSINSQSYSTVCEGVLRDGTDITYNSITGSVQGDIDIVPETGDWAVDFDYGTVVGGSVCTGTNSYSNGQQYYDCKCRTKKFKAAGTDFFTGNSSGTSYVTIFTSQNCPSTCTQTCAEKTKKEFQFRETLFKDQNLFNCPISSSFPEFLKPDSTTLQDGNTLKYCEHNSSSCDSIDENFQKGDWEVNFDYGTVVGTSVCAGTGSYSNGQQYYDCKCNTQTFTPFGGEIERALSSQAKIFTSQTCLSTCAQTCAEKTKKEFQFRETLYGGTHQNSTDLACQNTETNGNTLKYCEHNSSSCDSIDENFQKGDWEVNFDYGTVVGTSVCVGTNSYSNGKQYYDCKCNTQTFTPFGGEIERALSSQVKIFTSQTCLSTCAQTCAEKFSTDETHRQKFMTTNILGTCSGTAHKYTITYDNRGGTGCNNVRYGDGESVNLCEPTYSPKRFTGWATSSSGNPEYPAGYTVQSKSLSLYAGWNENCGDGLYGEPGSCQACPNGFNHTRSGSTENTQCYAICPDTLSCPTNVATCKYADADENNYDYYTTNETSICDIEVLTCQPGSIINRNKTACIQCSKVLYNDQCVDSCPSGTEAQNGVCVESQQPAVTITLDWNENGGNEISDGSCEYNNNLVLPSAPIRDGYTFNGWKLADNSIHNAGETITGGCIDTYIGTTTGTSNIITAQWSNCGTGYYCQNGIKTQCPESYPNTDSDTVSSAADCYAVKTAVCTQNECSNPNSVGCSGVTCGTCSCTGSTYKQYSNSTGTGDGVTEGTTTESCDKPIVSLTASLGYYIDGTSGCSICPEGYRNGTNAQNIHECYRECTTNDILHSSVVTGNDYYGMPDTCSALSCATHYHTYTNPDLMTEIGVDEAGNGFGYISIDGETTYNDYIYGLNAIDDKGKIIINYGSKGLVKGKAQCSSRNATEPFVDNTYILQSDSTIAILPDSTGRNCYCRLDGYTPYGSTTTVALAEPWVLFGSDNFSDAEDCAGSCTYYCAGTLHNAYEGDIAYRTAMFNSLNYPYQVCAPDTYTVSFVTNGAGIIDDISYVYGDTPIDLPQPNKDGFTFEGWFEDSDFQTLANNQYAPNDTITLYAKWSNCGTGYYCHNGIKTQCPESYPNTDSDTVSSAADCYSVKTATCIKQECVNPDSTGCDVVCEDCSCAGSTYKQYANLDGTGDGVTEGNTIESCAKQISSLSAKANHYLDNGTCPVCNVPFTTVETETSGATCPDGTVKSNATGTQQSYSLTCYHQTSTGGDIDYSECTGTQSCEERVYSACEITGCNQGYYLTSDNTICQECPTGYTCGGGTSVPQEIINDSNCRSGQISYENECVDNNFQITTIPNTKEIKFMFYAAGTYYVDCDTNSTSDTVKKVIVADSQTAMTSGTPVTCSYDIGGEYTIGFGGEATNYIESSIVGSSWYYAGTNNCSEWGVFRIGEQSNSTFTSHTSKIKNLSGSIGKIFPTLPGKPQPTFRSTFSGTTNLTSIPGNLFNGVYGQPGVCMFVSTFYGTAATSIPIGLFSYISGTSEGLFMSTFAGSKITSIDPGILRTIKGPARVGMFANMFMDANELRYLPENLFGGIYKVNGIDSTGMLKDAFRKAYSGGIKKLPNTMFSDFNGKPDTATFKNIFAHNTNLSGNYVPCHFFDSLDNTGFNPTDNTSPLDSIFHNTGLLSSCPKNMYQKITGFEDDFDGAVVCCDCPNGGTSNAGSVGEGSCTAAAIVCPAGQYLGTDQTSCSVCPSAYPNSPSGARSISQCYATVTYKFNNGDEDISVDVPYSSSSQNSYSIKLPEPSKTDYIFVGWNEQQDFSGDVLTDTAILSGNKTLYAQWTQVKCAPGQYLSLNGLYCEPCPTPYPHSIFDSKNKYACFATVSFYPNNATDNTKENYYYTDALPNGYKITNTPATNTNYEFIGWFENQNFTGNAITTESILVGDKSLYAQYGYSIQYDLDGGSLPNGQSNPIGYTATTATFTLINPTKTGHTFYGWCESNNNCANPQTTVTITQGSTTGNKYYYAKWTANKYDIIYKDGSDVLSTIQSPTEYTYSINAQTFTPTPEPTKRGFEFLGWSVSSTDTTNYSKTITVPAETTEDITFYAVWNHIGYDIHYHLNGGTNNSENPDNYIISELPLQLHDASRTGYIFAGWFDNAGLAGTPLTEISSDTVGEINLYAKWTAITYNVVFNGNKADGYKSAVVCTYDQYCDISNNNNFTYDGYIYMGWDTNKDSTTPLYPHTSSGISVFNLTNVNNATVLLYAIWKEHRIDLQYLYNDLNNNSEQDSCKYNYIFTPPVPPADAKPGFRFAGWRVETN